MAQGQSRKKRQTKEEVKHLLALLALVPSLMWGQVDTVYVIYGCTWPASCNYNDQATVDDGSCLDCTTPYEVGELLCDHYHGIDGIWEWWIALKCGGMEPPVETCDTIYIELPPDTVVLTDTLTLTDTLLVTETLIQTDTAYVQLPSDTVWIHLSQGRDTVRVVRDVDCFTGLPCGGGCDSTLYAPNAFTPDGDGLNDSWFIVTDPECWHEWECLIFDRWGALIWASDDPSEHFYGVGRERLHPAGVYTWRLTATTSTSIEPLTLTGHLSLIR